MAFLIPLPDFKDYTDQLVNFIQKKYDGHLVKIHFSKVLTVCTKNDKIITDKALSCPNVERILRRIPQNSILFGELFHRGAATDVPTLLNSGHNDLQLALFAAPIFSTKNIWNMDLCDVEKLLKENDLPFVETLRIGTITANLQHEFEWENFRSKLLEKAVELRQEGWVLKFAHMKGWYKLKPTRTVDGFVVTCKKSFSANHFGEIQSLVVGVYDEVGKLKIIADVGGGLSEEQRKVNPETLVGRVCEIEYDCLAKNRLRFPRFSRWREDKDSTDCKWSQLC